MRVLSNLLFKVTLSSMVLTAPAMITGRAKYDGHSVKDKEAVLSFYSSAVIEKFIDRPSITAVPTYSAEENIAVRRSPEQQAGQQPTASLTQPATLTQPAALTEPTVSAEPATLTQQANTVAGPLSGKDAKAFDPAPVAETASAGEPAPVASAVTGEKEVADNGVTSSAAAKAAELRMVINQAALIYSNMNLEKRGLDEKAFEYAWRGYHNLLKKGIIHKRTVLSICDFSQSCCSKRMYVIDVLHRKLLYRTYVAHGQNSGEEYATSFSNEPESFKSSLGFYVTDKIYYGRNGLSLRLNGVDSGYNDLALKRKIVLHGSTYVGDKYMQNFGTLGTSLGCPALPSALSGRIIRAVKNGSCLFIYHPTQQYLENSPVING